MFKSKALFLFLPLLYVVGCGANDTIVFSGTIEGKEIPVVSENSAIIVSIEKDEGDSVSPDLQLAKLDDKILQWQLKEAEAARDSAAAKWEEAKAGSRNQQIQQAMAALDQSEASEAQAGARIQQANSLVSQMDAQLAQVKSQLDGAKNTFSYQEKQVNDSYALYSANKLSEKEFEAQKEAMNQAATRVNQLQAQYQASLAQHESAKNEYAAAQAQLRAADAQKKSTGAQLSLLEEGSTAYTIKSLFALKEQAQAKVEQVKQQLEKSAIHSPVTGVILRRHVELGELVKPGTVMFTVMDPKSLELTMYVPESDLQSVRIGQEVAVKVDAYPNKTFRGKIARIADKAEFTPKNVQTTKERTKMVFAVKITLTEGWEELKPGMPADVLVTPVKDKGGK